MSGGAATINIAGRHAERGQLHLHSQLHARRDELLDLRQRFGHGIVRGQRNGADLFHVGGFSHSCSRWLDLIECDSHFIQRLRRNDHADLLGYRRAYRSFRHSNMHRRSGDVELNYDQRHGQRHRKHNRRDCITRAAKTGNGRWLGWTWRGGIGGDSPRMGAREAKKMARSAGSCVRFDFAWKSSCLWRRRGRFNSDVQSRNHCG